MSSSVVSSFRKPVCQHGNRSRNVCVAALGSGFYGCRPIGRPLLKFSLGHRSGRCLHAFPCVCQSNSALSPRLRAPVQRTRQPQPSADEIYLPRSLFINKQVVTRTSGRVLGCIGQIYVNTKRLEVLSLDLKSSQFATTCDDNILLSSLKQVGDVVLVNDETVLYDEPADERYGYVKLVGAVVETEDGVRLGKVRDYKFNPDTGAISFIKYDNYGLPVVPEKLVDVRGLSVDFVMSATASKIVMKMGADRFATLENKGLMDSVVATLSDTLGSLTTPTEQEVSSSWEQSYTEWYRQYGRQWSEANGVVAPDPADLYNTYRQTGVPQGRDSAYQLPPRSTATVSPWHSRTGVQSGQVSNRPQQARPREAMTQQQRGGQSAGAPASKDPRYRGNRGGASGSAVGIPAPPATPQQDNTVASIPIIAPSRRMLPPYRRRDIDGGYGELPRSATPIQRDAQQEFPASPPEPSGRSINEWLDPAQREALAARRPVPVGGPANGNAYSAGPRSTGPAPGPSRSTPPPPPQQPESGSIRWDEGGAGRAERGVNADVGQRGAMTDASSGWNAVGPTRRGRQRPDADEDWWGKAGG